VIVIPRQRMNLPTRWFFIALAALVLLSGGPGPISLSLLTAWTILVWNARV
jgi:hypothetical protein